MGRKKKKKGKDPNKLRNIVLYIKKKLYTHFFLSKKYVAEYTVKYNFKEYTN